MTLVTVFSAPKPFTDPHIATIQSNAIRSWMNLGKQVDVILVGDETGIAQAALASGTKYIPEVERNKWGTPLVGSIFDLAREASDSPILVYVNADILLTPSILKAGVIASGSLSEFLIIGRRIDLDIRDGMAFDDGWVEALSSQASSSGKPHPTGIDYFIFPREIFLDVPELAIGRAGWDNWMVYHARQNNWPVVDASDTVLAVHQNHDYGHLPGGRPHYRLEESQRNVTLAGGLRSVYGLEDADLKLTKDGIQKLPFGIERLLRKLEMFIMPAERRGPRWRIARGLGKMRRNIAY